MFYEPIEIKDSVKRVFISFGGAEPTELFGQNFKYDNQTRI